MIRTTAVKAARACLPHCAGRPQESPDERRAEHVRCTRSRKPGRSPGSELLLAGAGGAALLGAGGAARPAARPGRRAARKSGGTLRVGIGGGGPTDNFDAALINGPSATTRGQVFYETLVWLDGTFKLHNWLCDQCEPNAAADVWTVRLKQGLEFHNGKTVTADDVLFSIRRLLDPEDRRDRRGAARRARHEAQRRRSTSARCSFVLKRPTSFFDQVLSDIVYIVPVGYNPKKPVSTGPWKFVSYKPGQQTVLEPFANYWGLKPKVDKLVIVELPDDSARVNALLSGQVDAINQVPFAQVPVLQGQRQPADRRLADGRLEPDHDARRHGAVQRRARAPGDPPRAWIASRRSDGALRPGHPGLRLLRPLRPRRRHGLERDARHRAREVAAQGGRQVGPQGRARDLADLGGHRRGLPGAGPERQGGGHRHHAREGRRLDLLRRLRQVAVRGRLLGRPAVPRHGVAQRRAGRERRQHDALQRSRVQQALQPGRAPARRRQARARSSSACRRSSTTAAAT